MAASYISKLPNVGYLELIVGPMFSGKTSALIDLAEEYETKLHTSCFTINHGDDTRYGNDGFMRTHDRRKLKAHHTRKLMDFMKDPYILDFDVILINEGQFFPDLEKFVRMMVDGHKKKVHVAGLNGDFRKQAFGDILKLIPHCDDVRKLKATCGICKTPGIALFSMRKTRETAQKIVGSSNYIPTCRMCFEKFAHLNCPERTVTK